MAPSLQFFSESVLQRLDRGEFKPVRSQTQSVHLDDRRDRFSPLAVAKRAIKYDPSVYFNRKEELLTVAQSLNAPTTKLVCVTGETGCGKTSFVRGVVELMGGVPAQLLWFDVSRITDADSLIKFMLEYLAYVAESQRPASLDEDDEDGDYRSPLQHLQQLLLACQHFPILLVVEQIELFCNAQGELKSPALKDMLQFLMGFENVKLLMTSSVSPAFIQQIEGLTPKNAVVHALQVLDAAALLQPLEQLNASHAQLLKQFSFSQLSTVFTGSAALLRAWRLCLKHANQPSSVLNLLNASNKEALINNVFNWLWPQLSGAQQQLVNLLTLSQLPLNQQEAQELLQWVHNGPGSVVKTNLSDLDLNDALLKPLLKKQYPPQQVLSIIQQKKGSAEASGISASYEINPLFAQAVLASLPAEEQLRLHRKLVQFFQQQRYKSLQQRLLGLRSRLVVERLQYHQQQCKKLSQAPQLSAEESAKQTQQQVKEKTLQYQWISGASSSELAELEDMPATRPSYGKALLKQQYQEKLKNAGLQQGQQQLYNTASEAAPAGEAHSLDGLLHTPANQLSYNECEQLLKQLRSGNLLLPKQYQLVVLLAEAYEYQAKPQQAIETLQQWVLPLSEQGEELIFKAYGYIKLATVLRVLNQPKQALVCYYQALKRLAVEAFNDRALCYTALAELLDEQNQPQKALRFSLRALRLQQKLGNTIAQSILQYNIGALLVEQGKKQEAIGYFKSSSVLDAALGRVEQAQQTRQLIDQLQGRNSKKAPL